MKINESLNFDYENDDKRSEFNGKQPKTLVSFIKYVVLFKYKVNNTH